ncbi:MAG: hypothetical protein QXJ64_05985 [Thermosphaera sp.]
MTYPIFKSKIYFLLIAILHLGVRTLHYLTSAMVNPLLILKTTTLSLNTAGVTLWLTGELWIGKMKE